MIEYALLAAAAYGLWKKTRQPAIDPTLSTLPAHTDPGSPLNRKTPPPASSVIEPRETGPPLDGELEVNMPSLGLGGLGQGLSNAAPAAGLVVGGLALATGLADSGIFGSLPRWPAFAEKAGVSAPMVAALSDKDYNRLEKGIILSAGRLYHKDDRYPFIHWLQEARSI